MSSFGSSPVHFQQVIASLRVGSFIRRDGSAITMVPGLFVLKTVDGAVDELTDATLMSALTTSLVATRGKYKGCDVQIMDQTPHQFKVKVAMDDGSIRETAIQKKSLGFTVANPRRNARRSTRKGVTPVPALPERVGAECTVRAATRAAEGDAAAVEAEPAPEPQEFEPVADAPVDGVVEEPQAAAVEAEPAPEPHEFEPVAEAPADGVMEEPQAAAVEAEPAPEPVAEAPVDVVMEEPQAVEVAAAAEQGSDEEASLAATVAVEAEPEPEPQEFEPVAEAPVVEVVEGPQPVEHIAEDMNNVSEDAALVGGGAEPPAGDEDEDVPLDDVGAAFELDKEGEDAEVLATEGGRGAKRDVTLDNGEVHYPASKRQRRVDPSPGETQASAAASQDARNVDEAVPLADPPAILVGGEEAAEDYDSDSDSFGDPEEDPEVKEYFESLEARYQAQRTASAASAARLAPRVEHASDQPEGPDSYGQPARKRGRITVGDEDVPRDGGGVAFELNEEVDTDPVQATEGGSLLGKIYRAQQADHASDQPAGPSEDGLPAAKTARVDGGYECSPVGEVQRPTPHLDQKWDGGEKPNTNDPKFPNAMPNHSHRAGRLKQTNKRNKRSSASKRSLSSRKQGGKVQSSGRSGPKSRPSGGGSARLARANAARQRRADSRRAAVDARRGLPLAGVGLLP